MKLWLKEHSLAGCRAFFGYPCPSSEIAEYMAHKMPKNGTDLLPQAESELAAINRYTVPRLPVTGSNDRIFRTRNRP